VPLKIAIVGLGAVGAGIYKLFPDAAVYDEPQGIGTRESVNDCDVAFVCVPTPRGADGSCDTSIVESVVKWIDGPTIVLRSTVSIGTTSRLAKEHGKPIVFQPEYGPAETPDHPFNDLRKVRWIILGGDRKSCKVVARAWRETYSSDITIAFTTPEAAELCKYMENAYLAAKVTFCNEFFDIAEAVGVDYDELRELWLLDPRIGRTHTFVDGDRRGFGGKCLPKDLDALISTAEAAGVRPAFLDSVRSANERHRGSSRPAAGKRNLPVRVDKS
jgi:UDPglucose 6-dehydrogenase